MRENDTIRECSERCFKQFDRLCEVPVKDDPEKVKDTVQDEFARFKLWLSNIGVFAEVQLSLDFRVREIPEFRDLFLNHLDTIDCRLCQLYDVILQSQPPANTELRKIVRDTSSQAVSPELVTPETQRNPFEEWSTAELFESIHHSINWLHKLSNSIRIASRMNQNTRAADFRLEDYKRENMKSRLTEEQVRTVFANAIQEINNGLSEEMVNRLIASMVTRLKQILYRRSRQARWSLPETANPNKKERRKQLQVAFRPPSVINFKPKIDMPAHGSGVELTKGQNLLPSQVTNLPPHTLRRIALKSEISKATSRPLVPKGDEILIPSPPKEAATGNNFICPYCCLILPRSIAGDGKKWANHVKKDLNPYVCLFFPCENGSEIFATKTEWLSHMSNIHLMRWQCFATDHEPLVYDTSEAFEQHMLDGHKDTFPIDELALLTEISQHPVLPIFESCPFCANEKFESIEDHVGQHLQKVALRSLDPPWPDSSGASESSGPRPPTRSTVRDMRSASLDSLMFYDDDPDSLAEPGSRLRDWGEMGEIADQHSMIDPTVLLQHDYAPLADLACKLCGVSNAATLLEFLSKPGISDRFNAFYFLEFASSFLDTINSVYVN